MPTTIPVPASLSTHGVRAALVFTDTGQLLRSRSHEVLQSWAVRVAALTLVAAALRLYHLADKSIWYDEAFAITLGRMAVPDMIREVVRLDPHPPLYYLLMHVWLGLSLDPLLIRLPSAVAGALTVPLLYATGVRLVGRPAAFLAAGLLTVAPFHVFWAQQARMYALLGLLCLGSTYFLVRALSERRPMLWIAHVGCAVAALYLQQGAAFYLAAQDAGVLWLLVRRTAPGAVTRPWVLSQLAVGLLFAPWLPALAYQTAVYGDPGYARTSVGSLRELMLEFAFGWVPFWRTPHQVEGPLRDLLVVGALGLAGAGLWAVRRTFGVLAGFLFAGTIGLLAVVCLARGILVPKSLLPASPPLYLLLGTGLLSRGRSWLVPGVLGLVALSLVGLARMYTLAPEEDWRGAVAYLGREGHGDDLILVDASAGLMPLNYYLERVGLTRQVYGVPFRFWAVSPPPLTADDFQQANALVAGKHEFWLLVFRNGFPDPNGQLLPYLTERYPTVDARTMGKIRLYRFVAPAA